MKRKFKISSLFLVVFVFLFSLSAFAKSTDKYNISILKPNTWTPKKGYTYTYNSYDYSDVYTYYCKKIIIPEDGYIKVSIRGTYEWYLYTNLNAMKKDNYIYRLDVEPNEYVALEKGIYYLYCNDESSFKYTYKKKDFGANYSMRTALPAKKGNTIIAMNSSTNFFNKWYSLKLTKKSKIKIYVKQGDEDRFSVYDKNGRYCEIAHDGKLYYTKKTLKPGIYYIVSEGYYTSVFTIK